MPAHARPRPALISRPCTVMALSLAVSSLSVITLIHSPVQAMADEPSATTSPVVQVTEQDAKPVLALADVGRSRLAHLVEQRSAADLRRDRAAARAPRRAPRRAPQWVMPVPGAGLSAYFGEAGSAWSSGYHTGQDFTASAGTPVLAVGAGTITSASWSDAYGNNIEITHANGDQSWYAHMSSFERTSGSVSAGDIIGYVGCTGNCFGTHLHFEYHPDGGEAADPLPWLHRNGAY